jgi:hypothetical protein
VVYRLLCPASRTGSVIGQGGEILKQLRADTGARIRVEDTVRHHPQLTPPAPNPDCMLATALLTERQHERQTRAVTVSALHCGIAAGVHAALRVAPTGDRSCHPTPPSSG